MSKLQHRQVVLAKTEAVHGTDSLPVPATDAVLVDTVGWSNAGIKMNKRPAIRASLAQLQDVFGGTLITITLSVDAKGSGVAGTPPEFGALLRACGFVETINAGVSVIYAPSSDANNHDTCTIYLNEDGVQYILTGCRGNLQAKASVQTQGKLTFQMTGHLKTPLTDVVLPTPTYQSSVPAPYINAAFKIGAYAGVIADLSFDMANTVSMPKDVAAADGFSQPIITMRDLKGTIDPEADSIANFDVRAALMAGTDYALDSGIVGSVAGNKWQVQMPAIFFRNATSGNRDNLITRQLEFGAKEVAGDDEISITFT